MWLDEILKRAREEGHFDTLSHQGKRLQLHNDPYEPQNMRAANRILKQSGATLPWIAERKTIEHDIEVARKKLRQQYRWYLQQSTSRDARANYDRARSAFLQQVEKLNRRIRDFNLKAPSAQVHLHQLRPEKMIRQIERDTRDNT